VTIETEADRLRIVIADNGRGGAMPDQARDSGLAGLDDRVAAIEGTLLVDSPVTSGTRVIASLPLPPAVTSLAEA
jgi:signal transduction histidine kinase